MIRADRGSLECVEKLKGFTLIEMLVTLFILALLATVALPYAEISVIRSKEADLSRSLRQIRTAIDRFHDDWEKGKISMLSGAASDDGYPITLRVLVEGVNISGGGIRKYLRKVPADPFADPSIPPDRQWVKRGYQDRADSMMWNGTDVYDVRTASEDIALNGTHYRDW